MKKLLLMGVIFIFTYMMIGEIAQHCGKVDFKNAKFPGMPKKSYSITSLQINDRLIGYYKNQKYWKISKINEDSCIITSYKSSFYKKPVEKRKISLIKIKKLNKKERLVKIENTYSETYFVKILHYLF